MASMPSETRMPMTGFWLAHELSSVSAADGEIGGGAGLVELGEGFSKIEEFLMARQRFRDDEQFDLRQRQVARHSDLQRHQRVCKRLSARGEAMR